MINFFKRKPKLTKEQAQAEIDEMVSIYRRKYPSERFGFLSGSSICGKGYRSDSGRYWKLRKILMK